MEGVTIGDRLQVRFDRVGDRYAHSIGVLCGADWHTAVESIEESADVFWPASPPLQQLNLTQLPDGRQAALLIGMAGRSHWSLSVAAARDELFFDVACRAQEPPAWLGSRYRGRSRLEKVGEDMLRLAMPTADIQLRLEPPAGSLSTDGDILSVHCNMSATVPATFRWAYRLRVSCPLPVSP